MGSELMYMWVRACVLLGPGWVYTPAALSKEGSGGGYRLAGPDSVISMNTGQHEETTWTPMSFSAFGPIAGLAPSPRAHCCTLGLKSLKETVPVSWHSVPSSPLTPSPWFIRLGVQARPEFVTCILLILSRAGPSKAIFGVHQSPKYTFTRIFTATQPTLPSALLPVLRYSRLLAFDWESASLSRLPGARGERQG